MRSQNKWIIFLLLLTCCAEFASAQMTIRLATSEALPPDSADIVRGKEKHFWRGAGEVVGFNIALWSFNRYVVGQECSHISLNSIKENFKKGFVWDNDNLATNTFMHPYHGSLFYNAGRSNGYNFWQSELFAIGGSAMWEFFMENEYPSTNDIIATPIGGAAIGETLFRASDVVIKDCSWGWERAGREIAAFIISPMRGINRLVSGAAWRRSTTTGRIFGTPQVAFDLSLGSRALWYEGSRGGLAVGGTLEARLEYGDRFEDEFEKPYDYFTAKLHLDFMKGQPVIGEVRVVGRLLGKSLINKRKNKLIAGLYQHFDYFDSDTIAKVTGNVPYKLGVPASLGGGLIWRNAALGNWTFDAYTHFNAVILGCLLSDHYKVDSRNYNFASGFSLKTGVNAIFMQDRLSIAASYDYYRLFTWRGYRMGTHLEDVDERTLNVMGDHSAASFHIFDWRVTLRLAPRLYSTLGIAYYRRHSHYRDYPDIIASSLGFSAKLTYKF